MRQPAAAAPPAQPVVEVIRAAPPPALDDVRSDDVATFVRWATERTYTID